MATNRICQAAFITGFMLIAPIIAHAQKTADTRHKAAAPTIVGSWLETVNVAGGPTFKSLATFTGDGAFVSHDQGSVVTDPLFPHVYSAGHGVWVQEGGRAFTATFVQLISDLSGTLLYVNTVRESVTLSKSRDAYRAVWIAEFSDPDGNPIVSFEGTSDGRRIKAALTVPSPR